MGTIQTIDNVDNTGTLYEEVLVGLYGENADMMLTNTKFLRINILKAIKDFIQHEKTIFIKEFSTAPIMTYATSDEFDLTDSELTTDLVIVPQAFSLSVINNTVNNMPHKFPLVLEALNTNGVTTEMWDNHLDEIYTYYADGETPVHKIVIEDVISLLKKWNDSDNQVQKNMIKAYNATFNISDDTNTFWQEPLNLISKKYWDKFSFVLTLNDYEIYDNSVSEYLDIVAEKYFNNGYFDEIVIKINYFYWNDDFQKIVDWAEQNLKSALVSYRFDTIFSNEDKNRYFDEAEALKYNDTLRQNTIEEELEMFETRLPILLEKMLTNPQTYGFELEGGYFGAEGYVSELSLDSIEFNEYKQVICKILNLSPFSQQNDNFVRVFREPDKKIFVCMRTAE